MKPDRTQQLNPAARLIMDEGSCHACMVYAARLGVTIGQYYRLREGVLGRVIRISHETVVRHQRSDPTITVEFGNNILLLPMQRILNYRIGAD